MSKHSWQDYIMNYEDDKGNTDELLFSVESWGLGKDVDEKNTTEYIKLLVWEFHVTKINSIRKVTGEEATLFTLSRVPKEILEEIAERREKKCQHTNSNGNHTQTPSQEEMISTSLPTTTMGHDALSSQPLSTIA